MKGTLRHSAALFISKPLICWMLVPLVLFRSHCVTALFLFQESFFLTFFVAFVFLRVPLKLKLKFFFSIEHNRILWIHYIHRLNQLHSNATDDWMCDGVFAILSNYRPSCGAFQWNTNIYSELFLFTDQSPLSPVWLLKYLYGLEREMCTLV